MTDIHATSLRTEIFPIKETTEASPSFHEANSTTSPLHSVLESSTGQKRKLEDCGTDTRPQRISEKVHQAGNCSFSLHPPASNNTVKTHMDPAAKDSRVSSPITPGLDKRVLDRNTSISVNSAFVHTRDTKIHPQFIQKQDKKHGLRRLWINRLQKKKKSATCLSFIDFSPFFVTRYFRSLYSSIWLLFCYFVLHVACAT